MVRIITDSAADFEPAELEKLNISCIPLSVMLEEKSYRENIDLGKKRFYELPPARHPKPLSLLRTCCLICSGMPRTRAMKQSISPFLPVSAVPIRLPGSHWRMWSATTAMSLTV